MKIILTALLFVIASAAKQSHAQPTVSFAANRTTGCAPKTVRFTSTVTGFTPTRYLWQFGNGDTSTDANPVYIYPAPGRYRVSLTVYNGTMPFTRAINNYIFIERWCCSCNEIKHP